MVAGHGDGQAAGASTETINRHRYRRIRRDTRNRINQLLGEIGTPQPWTIDAFVERVAAFRGRPIELAQHEWHGRVAGMWCALETADAIVVDATSTALHREHTIAHELGHMLLGHQGRTSVPDDIPRVDPRLAKRMGIETDLPPLRHRDHYDDDEELAAEVAASLIWRYAGRRLLPARTLTGAAAAAVDRFAAVMGRTRR